MVKLRVPDWSLSEDLAEKLPDRIFCTGCGMTFITFKKNARKRKVRLQMHITKPPRIVDLERWMGEIDCQKCGAVTPIDLRVFVDAPPTH